MGKYSKYGESGEYVDRIGFDDLVKLYVNHRPVFAVGPEQIRLAFEAMKRHEPGPIQRDTLLSLLQSSGEPMTLAELEKCFEALVGDKSVQRVLDEEVEAAEFAREVLGLQDADEDQGADNADHGSPG